jgi:hypothetical protein
MTRSFSHYTDGDRVYLSKNLKIFLLKEQWRLTRRLREQARSHIWNAFPRGSEPAREEAGRLNEE